MIPNTQASQLVEPASFDDLFFTYSQSLSPMVRLQTSARTHHCNTSSFSISGISHFGHCLPGFLLTPSYTPTSTTVNHTEVSNSLNLPPFLTASYSVPFAPLSRLNPRLIIIITALHAPHPPAVSPALSYSMAKPATRVTANTSGSLPATVQPNSEARKQTATLGGLTVNFKTASPRGDQVSPRQQPCCTSLHIQF